MTLRVFLLGRFHIESKGHPVPTATWKRSSAQTLVKLLATQPGHRLHREVIAETLWPDRDPDAASNALRKALHFARHALEPDLEPGRPSSHLHADEHMLALDPACVWIDVDAFERLATEALSGGDVAAYERALAAYGGELLPGDRYEDWAAQRRAALAARQTALLLGLAAALEREGALERARECLRDVVANDPANEEAHRRLMRLYALSGSHHQALRQYQQCCRALQNELGAAPDRATTALYADILAGRLAPRAPAPSPLPAAIRHAPTTPLVGRERAMHLLRDALFSPLQARAESAAPPRDRVTLISGEAGVGKSRLAAEAARSAHARGACVLWGTSYEQEGQTAYGPFVEALDGYVARYSADERATFARTYPQLARLLPSVPLLTQPTPASAGSDVHRQRLFMDVVRFLADLGADRPVLLVLDDLHVADEASLHLLHYLTRLAPEHRWLVVGTYREEDAEPGSAVHRLRDAVTRAGLARHIDLLRLARSDCDLLIQSLQPGLPADPAFLERVYMLSLGNPLFAQEVAQALGEKGAPAPEGHAPAGDGPGVPAGDGPGVPQAVRALVEARVERMGADVGAALTLAAVAGGVVSFSELRLAALDAAAGGLSDIALLDALDRALRARILQEHEHGYAFRHPLFQAALYRRLSRQRRSYLHAALARAIEQTRPADVEALARHYARGADEEKALLYLERAGDRAAALFADGAAEEYYRALLERMDRLGRAADGARVREKLGAVLQTAGRLGDALTPLQQAAALLRKTGDLEALGRVTARLGWVHGWRGTAEEGARHVQETLDALDAAGARYGRAALYAARAHLYFVRGRYDEQRADAQRAAALAREEGDQAQLGAALCRYGVALSLVGRYAEALAAQEEAITVATAADDLPTLRSALYSVASRALFAGELERCARYGEQALAVAERLGDPAQIAFLTAARGDVALTRGDWPQAAVAYEQAVALSSRWEESWATPYPLLGLGLLHLVQGTWNAAAGYLEQGVGLAERGGDTQALRWGTGLLAWHDLLQGRPAEARARLLPLLDLPGKEEPLVTAFILPYLARAQLDLGELDPALATAEEAVRRARAQGFLMVLPSALTVYALAALRVGRPAAAMAGLDEGLRLARGMPFPFAEAHLLSAYGEMHRTQNRRQAARGQLNAALSIFRQLGARKEAEHVEQLLAALA